jgi:hypothetical protein
MRFLSGLVLIGSGLLAAIPLAAGTVTFDYAGTPGASYSSGPGSFSYVGPLASVGLGDLTSFSFDLCVNNGGTCFVPFALADLLSFSATIAGGSVSALSLTTDFVVSITPGGFPEDFVVSGLGADQAQNNANHGDGFIPTINLGIVTTDGPGVSGVPEPGTMFPAAAGLIFAWLFLARKPKRPAEFSK